jgi:hypothetical protein
VSAEALGQKRGRSSSRLGLASAHDSITFDVKESIVIITLLVLGWTLVVVTVVCMCRASALADTAARDLVPFPVPREERAASPPSLRKAA